MRKPQERAAAMTMLQEAHDAAVVAIAAETERGAAETSETSRQRARGIAFAVAVSQRKAIKALRKAVTEKPVMLAQRNLLALRAVETGLTLATIGADIGYAASTVGKWVNRARDEVHASEKITTD